MFDSFLSNFIIEYIWVIIFKSLVLPLFIFIAVWVLPVEHLVDGSRTGVEDVTLESNTILTRRKFTWLWMPAWEWYTILSMRTKMTRPSVQWEFWISIYGIWVMSKRRYWQKLWTRPPGGTWTVQTTSTRPLETL